METIVLFNKLIFVIFVSGGEVDFLFEETVIDHFNDKCAL